MRGYSEVDNVPRGVPGECEGHYRLFLKMIKSAANDILRGQPGSERFESAVEWLTEGWGYQMMCGITRAAEKMKEHWLMTANRRRSRQPRPPGGEDDG